VVHPSNWEACFLNLRTPRQLIRSVNFLSSEREPEEVKGVCAVSRDEKARRVYNQMQQWHVQHAKVHARFVALGIDVGGIPLPIAFCVSNAQRIRFCCAMITLHHRSGFFGHRNWMNEDGSLDFFCDIHEQTDHGRVIFSGPRAALQFLKSMICMAQWVYLC
jgi:hypothetical protein